MQHRTTVRLDETLLRKAKKLAAGQGTTLTALIEEGLRTVLANAAAGRAAGRRTVALPVSQSRGGPLPGIDLDDSRGLYDLLDDSSPSASRVAESPPKKKTSARRQS